MKREIKCPKCGSLLLKDKFGHNKDKTEYYCIGCSSYGTLENIEIQKNIANSIRDASVYKVKCKICGKSISTSAAKIIKYKFSQSYVCINHKEKEYENYSK